MKKLIYILNGLRGEYIFKKFSFWVNYSFKVFLTQNKPEIISVVKVDIFQVNSAKCLYTKDQNWHLSSILSLTSFSLGQELPQS